ncbi:hypothetical protein BDZ97DRAFT_1759328 [Flammula alnicola]|nr:hypothetical protein BDZ97DRAFT_1759328 [Flammula alnicola]
MEDEDVEEKRKEEKGGGAYGPKRAVELGTRWEIIQYATEDTGSRKIESKWGSSSAHQRRYVDVSRNTRRRNDPDANCNDDVAQAFSRISIGRAIQLTLPESVEEMTVQTPLRETALPGERGIWRAAIDNGSIGEIELDLSGVDASCKRFGRISLVGISAFSKLGEEGLWEGPGGRGWPDSGVWA